jgi:hypothetical protein
MSSVRRWVLTHTELEAVAHGFLFQVQLKRLSFLAWVLIGAELACKPGLKFPVLAMQQFQDFADNVGWICIKELCVPVQVGSDVFLQANLEQCSFWLF